MSGPHPVPDLDRVLTDLDADREAMSWPERRALAASLREQLAQPDCHATALGLVRLLADDPKWEVRKEIAGSLTLLPDDELLPLAARLTSDSNSFVRKAAERCLDRRKRGLSQPGPRRGVLAQILCDLEEVERKHGRRLANKVRQLVDQLYDSMAGTAVHELRGILTPLKSATNRLRERTRKRSHDNADLEPDLNVLSAGLEFLERFVDDVRAYSQSVPVERTPAQLGGVIAEAHRLVRVRLEASNHDLNRLDVSISVDPRITVCIARHGILAAVRNVLTNAYEAVLLRGSGADGRISLEAVVIEGVEARIAVCDNGIGICEEDLREVRAFIPGRTTKKGSGTGFGLPIAHRNITAHGGTISIESEEGIGTRVIMTLPVEGFSEGGK